MRRIRNLLVVVILLNLLQINQSVYANISADLLIRCPSVMSAYINGLIVSGASVNQNDRQLLELAAQETTTQLNQDIQRDIQNKIDSISREISELEAMNVNTSSLDSIKAAKAKLESLEKVKIDEITKMQEEMRKKKEGPFARNGRQIKMDEPLEPKVQQGIESYRLMIDNMIKNSMEFYKNHLSELNKMKLDLNQKGDLLSKGIAVREEKEALLRALRGEQAIENKIIERYGNRSIGEGALATAKNACLIRHLETGSILNWLGSWISSSGGDAKACAKEIARSVNCRELIAGLRNRIPPQGASSRDIKPNQIAPASAAGGGNSSGGSTSAK